MAIILIVGLSVFCAVFYYATNFIAAELSFGWFWTFAIAGIVGVIAACIAVFPFANHLAKQDKRAFELMFAGFTGQAVAVYLLQKHWKGDQEISEIEEPKSYAIGSTAEEIFLFAADPDQSRRADPLLGEVYEAKDGEKWRVAKSAVTSVRAIIVSQELLDELTAGEPDAMEMFIEKSVRSAFGTLSSGKQQTWYGAFLEIEIDRQGERESLYFAIPTGADPNDVATGPNGLSGAVIGAALEHAQGDLTQFALDGGADLANLGDAEWLGDAAAVGGFAVSLIGAMGDGRAKYDGTKARMTALLAANQLREMIGLEAIEVRAF